MALDKPLSKREREMMEILHRLGPSSAKDIQGAMKDPPSYSAVRSTLRILEDKGHLTHRSEGQTYIYRPKADPKRARKSAIQHVMTTFFGGSAEQLVATLLDASSSQLSRDELDKIAELVEAAREEGR